MAQNDGMSDLKTGQKTGADRRADRLRAALRENLKRRKAQGQAKAKAKSAGRGSSAPGREGAPDTVSVNDLPEAPDTPNSAGFAPDKAKG